MTAKAAGALRQIEYLNGRVPEQDRMTVKEKTIVEAAIAYVLASERPQELYVALEAAVLAYLPPMVETTEEEK